MGSEERCSSCGNFFSLLKQHWNMSDCEEVGLTERQTSILTGLFLSDMHISKGTEGGFNAVLVNTNLEFLEWVDEEMGVLSNGIRLRATAEQATRYSPDAVEQCNPVYVMSLKAVDDVTSYHGWYKSGEKRFPKDLELDSLMTKVWYCGDGGLSWNRDSGAFCSFGVKNEIDRPNFLLELFNELEFHPTISGWSLKFTRNESKELLDYMGAPLPGMEYKWESEDRTEYKRLKEIAYDADGNATQL